MAKNAITDYDTTAASNTDLGGVDSQGSAPASNIDNLIRELMSHLAETNAGTSPWADTMTIGDAADLTKKFRLELSGITAGQTRVMTVPDYNFTVATLAGTETFTNKTLTSPVLTTPALGTPASGTLDMGSITLTGTLAQFNTAISDDNLTGQQTIWVPAGAMVANTTNGAASGSAETGTNDVMYSYLAFDATTSESAQFSIQMPKNWDESTLIAQFVWTHPAAAAFGVVWGIAAVAFANDDALDTAFGTAVEVADTGGTTADVYITAETGAVTVAGTPGAEEYVTFKVYRDPADASDTMAVDAYLLGVKVHYTTSAITDD